MSAVLLRDQKRTRAQEEPGIDLDDLARACMLDHAFTLLVVRAVRVEGECEP